MKINVPLNLKRFEVLSSKRPTSSSSVIDDLKNLRDYLGYQEQRYLQTEEYRDLIFNLVTGNEKVSGSKNSWARKRVEDFERSAHQPYNCAEMLRTNITNKLEQHAQSVALFDLIDTYEEIPDANHIRQDFKNNFSLKLPAISIICQHVRRFEKGKKSPRKGTSGNVIPLYACDTHYSKIEEHTSKHIDLKIKLKSSGETVLRFPIPNSKRFLGDKVTRPTIIFKAGRPIFCFTIEKRSPERILPNAVSFDLGKVDPLVGTVIYPGENEFSAPYFAGKQVRRIRKREMKMRELGYCLRNKAKECRACSQDKKAEILETESRRVLNVATSLKHEFATQVARNIVEIADENNAIIQFENLRWLESKGGKWHFAEIQKKTESLAKQRGISVKYVNAKNTSQECSVCGKKVRKSGRNLICHACGKRLNRDVSSSRVMGIRELKNRYETILKQKNSAHMRVSYPATLANSAWSLDLLTKVELIQGVKVHNLSAEMLERVDFIT